MHETQALFVKLIGEWEGTTRTWFEPDVLADEARNFATIRSVGESRFLLHEYKSSVQGKRFHGVAIYGYNSLEKRYEGSWVDSFHMSTNIMLSTGEATPDGFSLLGSYADGQGGPDWGWRTVVKVVDDDSIVITAFNITPGGEEAKAVETAYRRKIVAA